MPNLNKFYFASNKNTLFAVVNCGTSFAENAVYLAEKCSQCGIGTYHNRGSPQVACAGHCEWKPLTSTCVPKGKYFTSVFEFGL